MARGQAFPGPMVSIGLPCYNRAAGLKHTLDAMLAQTYVHWELHISDNASTDPEVEAIGLAYAAKDARIRYHRQAVNCGMSRNFIEAARFASSGDYFMWVADDDDWHPSFIEVCMDLVRAHPDAGLVCPSFSLTNLDGVEIGDNGDYRRYNQPRPTVSSKTAFLWEPEVMGKANIMYGLYSRALIDAILPLWPRCDVQDWAGDYVFAYAACTRAPMFFSEALLMRKEVRTHVGRWFVKTPVYQSFPFFRWFYYTRRLMAVAPGRFDRALVLGVMTIRLLHKALVALPRKIFDVLRRHPGVLFKGYPA